MSEQPPPDAFEDKTLTRKKDRPPALDLQDSNSFSNKSPQQERDAPDNAQRPRPSVQVSLAVEIPSGEPESTISRPQSTTSSLDPYYFGIQTPSDSPAPPLPTRSTHITPEVPPLVEPTTPAKDPSRIDRRGLVGVGELATPRWGRMASDSVGDEVGDQHLEGENNDINVPENLEKDDPDSPWTIEAVDGEEERKEEDLAEENDLQSGLVEIPRVLRSRPSVAEESGGEEILYPRKSSELPRGLRLPQRVETGQMDSPEASPQDQSSPRSPPSAFASPLRRAKKRTSDEFELDQHGSLIPKQPSSSGKVRDKKDHRRKDSTGNSPVVARLSLSSKGSDRHMRQSSGGSNPGSHSDSAVRRVQTDFSHLPPSPSSSSIQQFLRHTGSQNSVRSSALRAPSRDAQHQGQVSPNVAHSVLRGAQEGLHLDDDATAEALRKLDGMVGKTARARASIGSVGRPTSLSRPGSPPNKSSIQWEGNGLSVRRGSAHSRIEAEGTRQAGLGLTSEYPESSSELNGSAIASSDDQRGSSSAPEKGSKKISSASARSSFAAKRGSASSTNYTGTPSSRDSASMSATTNGTSVSATSGRHSAGAGKARRNSGGSETSSIHSPDVASLKDRNAAHSNAADIPEEVDVPPVPPLPKDLSTYRSPPPSSASQAFPIVSLDEPPVRASQDYRGLSLEVPSPLSGPSTGGSSFHGPSSLGSISDSYSPPIITKTPSKKWSFSALSSKLSGSPSSKSSGFPTSPKQVTFGQQIRKSTSKDQGTLSPPAGKAWQPTQPDAMTSAASLASLSSVGSVSKSPVVQSPGIPLPPLPVHHSQMGSSRPGTSSSINTNLTTSALSISTAPPSHNNNPLSPSSSIKRAQSTRRLTPSSIPFFRRSSSQSMQMPPPITTTVPQSPSQSSAGPSNSKSSRNNAGKDSVPSTPSSTQKKSSMLSLGTLLKSSSRRSLHADKSDSGLDTKKAEKEKARIDKERQKKEDKDRSESRISVLMGRKRGKTVSATDAKKPVPVDLPPLQMSAIPSATAQRVANLKSNNTTPTGSISTPRSNSASRLTSATASSMMKQSDASLRSIRNQLPTIAGSPSTGAVQQHQQRQANNNRPLKESPPPSLMTSLSGLPKETPTKIPRISSRTSAPPSPPLKSTVSAQNHQTSANISGLPATSGEALIDEFGVIENNVEVAPVAKSTARQNSIRSSPSTASISTSASRVPRQVSNAVSTSGILPRKSQRDSLSFGLRKSSTGSVASIASVAGSEQSQAQPQQTQSHRFSALSPSKGLKLLTPKMSMPSTRSSHSTSSIHQNYGASSSRQSLSTPSPVNTVDDEEILGDDEMLHYIRRQQAKKMATGATQEELDELLCFPEPLPPGTPSSPASILSSHQAMYLSDFEKREILDYPSVYCIGARSKKKPATVDNPTNNHSYDDDRGDYLVVNHDHLAYRYEIMDTLGKGSFGQVLHCRDHCTGESVAIKIIRNKKRFHHQALVEIKILDNLRKWDAEEKHHVIKMTEHFYFRNHLCIAMELLSINLYELIKANGFVGFSTTLIRRFTSQMLHSLSLMRHHRIVHCDLKPENVLLRHPAKSAIKVIDFGSSCFEHEKIYTYIQSRFYRSPEVILGMNYHMAIDMWSLGCIMAELYTGFPIFPGENEQEQLSCIMEVLGVPDKDFVNRSSRKKLFFDPSGAPRAVINSKGRRRRPGTKTLSQALRCNDEDFLDFIGKCLIWDPERRIKPQAALRHPFITAGRRSKPSGIQTPAKSIASGISGSRSKQQLNETPKKSQISAPAPLTARSARTNGSAITATPSSATLGSASKSYRTSQSQGLTHYSSRTLSGIAVSKP